MKLLIFVSVLSVSAVGTPAIAEFTNDEMYNLGELAAVCGLYYQKQLTSSGVRHWSQLTANTDEAAQVLRLTRGMLSAWIADADKNARIRTDFISCYDIIIETLEESKPSSSISNFR